MIAVIITNIILVVAIGIVGVVLLAEAIKNTDEAERKCAEYKGLYEHELQKNGDVSSIRSRKFFLEGQVERLTKELNSCEDRIGDMAQENAELKEQIKALKKTAKKKGEK